MQVPFLCGHHVQVHGIMHAEPHALLTEQLYFSSMKYWLWLSWQHELLLPSDVVIATYTGHVYIEEINNIHEKND